MSQKIKIKPEENYLQLDIEETKVGVLDTSSKRTVPAYGVIAAVADNLKDKYKKGQKIFFAPWAVDIVNMNEEIYYFLNVESNGLIAAYE